MGFCSTDTDAIVLDLETVGRSDVEQIVDPVSAPANYKDAEKIAAKKKEKLDALIERAALDVNLCRIVAIGVEVLGDCRVSTLPTETDEVLALKRLAELIDLTGHGGLRRVITFNGLHFDLLVLMRRALILGVKFPRLDVGAPWRNPNTDLMQVLTYNGATAKHSLDFYCRVLSIGIDIKVSDEVKAVTGADIPRLVAEDRWDLVEGHCLYDVKRTAMLARRVGALS
jgi:DNA polymerase III epsilon subunit-like protein